MTDYSIYVNGVLKKSGLFDRTGTPILFSPSHKLALAAYAAGRPNDCFAGEMDEVRVWRTARTQSEILANMNLELSTGTGLVFVYHLNQGVAGGNNAGMNAAADASGNGYNGTLNDFALSGATSNWVSGQTLGIAATNNAPATYALGLNIVTWKIADAAGNTSTCQQTITVIDNNQAPAIATQPTAQAGCVGSNATFSVAATGPGLSYQWQKNGTNIPCTQGLTAEYFNNVNLSGAPTLTRTETSVNYSWGNGSPGVAGIGNDNFSVRWSGFITAPLTRTYTFKTITDDGVRLWVNNSQLIDKWMAQGSIPQTGTIALTAGQVVPIKMEYYEANGGAVAQLFWSYPDKAEQIIPQSAFVAFAAACSPNYTIANAGLTDAGNYSVVVSGACASVTSNAVALTVNPFSIPSVSIDVTSGSSTTNFGTAVTFTATLANGGTSPTYQWKKDGVNVGSNSATYTDDATTGGAITCVMTSNAVCVSPTTATSNAITLVVTLTPDVVCPTNITVNNEEDLCSAAAIFAATDVVSSPASTITYSQNPGTAFTVGTTTVTATATSTAGTDNCTFTVTVVDNQTPDITCPSNVADKTSATSCNAVATWTAPVGTDNCLGVTTVGTKNPGSTFPTGTTEVKYTATDASGNTKTCTFIITVTDNQPPTAICPANTTVAVNGLSCPGTVGTYALVSKSDNCTPSFNLTESQSPSPGEAVGVAGAVVTVTLTAKDDNGNEGSCFFTLIGVEVNATYYPDADRDGYGSDAGAGCQNKPGYVTKGGDCDDTNPAIYPGADEVCGNDIDENCNGLLVELNCPGATGSVSPACLKIVAPNSFSGEMLVTFGGEVAMVNPTTRVSATVGQPFIGDVTGANYSGTVGFWGRLLVPPAGPVVEATEGDLPDRVQIKWRPDPLSPASTSYNIYRDGVLLNSVSGEIRSMIDFNVIAGQIYRYEVTGVNGAGEGVRGATLGFVNPNGVVTGQVTSKNGNPVKNTLVKLTPTLGTALEFGGNSQAFATYSNKFPKTTFTASCWAQLRDGNPASGGGIFDLGSHVGKNWWLHATTPAPGQNGVTFGVGQNATAKTELSFTLPDSSKNAWHHYAATFNAGKLMLFVDGELVGSTPAEWQPDSTILSLGRRTDGSGNFKGKLDDLRFFSRALQQTEILETMLNSAPSNTPGLSAYWKFDEGTGVKAFDLSANRFKMYLCGADWTADKVDVASSGVTDATGYYEIEGVNYGAGQTFTAIPSKAFHFNQSLEFTASASAYAELTDFDLPDAATLEITARNFDFSATQTLLSKPGNLLQLDWNAGSIWLKLGSGAAHNFGPVSTGYHRLAFTLQQTGGSVAVVFYKDGATIGNHTFSGVDQQWKGSGKFLLGKKTGGNFYSGLIDEVAFYAAALPAADIASNQTNGTNTSHPKLFSYFSLNEGDGAELTDLGYSLSGTGKIYNATWSTVVAKPNVQPHEFSPASRLVTLNPSSTSVDQIDFRDESTIPVSGVVRFDGTDCFQKQVEILVNGKSHDVPIYTDKKGEFKADFEPGAKAVLTPKFEDHKFSPAFWEIKKVTTPVAGTPFRNTTKRQVMGQLAGGKCLKSILPASGTVWLELKTLNDCYRDTVKWKDGAHVADPTNTGATNGNFRFNNVPPDSVTVAVIRHPHPDISNFFEVAGGKTLDLRKLNDTTDFVYYAPPSVTMTPFATQACADGTPKPIMQSMSPQQVTVTVFQDYYGQHCSLDTAELSFNNLITGLPQFDTLMTKGSLTYKFMAGEPLLTPPHEKLLEVKATAGGRSATYGQKAIVVGDRPRVPTFRTKTPQEPFLVLHDPPGDASYAYFEAGSQVCNETTVERVEDNGGGTSTFVSIIPKFTAASGTPFFSVETEVQPILQLEGNFLFTTHWANTKSQVTCVSPTRTISTADDDMLVGPDADVFMGAAQNIIIGQTDKLVFDPAACAFNLTTGAAVTLDSFSTTFVYSRHHIVNAVIPYFVSTGTAGDLATANQWRKILLNDSLAQLNKLPNGTTAPQNAPLVGAPKNYSFSSGLSIEESMSVDTTKADATTVSETPIVDIETLVTAGIFGNEAGATATGSFVRHTERLKTTGTENTRSHTAGYFLKDDDPGDNFTVDVMTDNRFGTHFFRTRSGESSCPWEKNTRSRDEVEISVDRVQITGVPEDEAAVFHFTLGNISQTKELRNYFLFLGAKSNAGGAVVKANGTNLAHPLGYQIPYGEPQEVTVTVERGPGGALSYSELEIALYVQCHDERYTALGLGPETEPVLYKALLISANFVAPCSRVHITFPKEDFVKTALDGNTQDITFSGYDKAAISGVRLQYRRGGASGPWVNIVENIPVKDLGDDSHTHPWDLSSLSDGIYELRAITLCASAAGLNGFSKIVSGTLERTPPEVFGVPEPADGILSPGDEISIRFNEPLQCDRLIKADALTKNNVGLYNAETDKPVGFNFGCVGDKIVLVPTDPDKFLENKTLRAEVHKVKDFSGLETGTKTWEFVVDRNPLNWLDKTPIYVAKYGDEVRTETRRIENRGGLPVSFRMDSVPTWVKVSPRTGTLAGGQVLPVTFVFDSTLAYGSYEQTVQLSGTFGNEPMPVTARVVCHDPGWKVNAAHWEHSMNLAVALNIEGTLSEDIEDIVGAFVDGELRGTAKVQKVQLGTTIQYVAFLTVFGNTADLGKGIYFEIWDASKCGHYIDITETFLFEENGLVGSPGTPQVLHINQLVLRGIELRPGLNWISFNLAFPDARLNEALWVKNGVDDNNDGKGDYIKSNIGLSTYSSVGGWIGNLSTLENQPMYKYRSPDRDTILHWGTVIDPKTMPISIDKGWNWLGYLPSQSLPVGEALQSLTPANGDLLKSQTQFAQYITGFGWIGSLERMSPPNGYLLKSASAGTLTYPANTSNRPEEFQTAAADRGGSIWEVNPAQFEHTQNLIGILWNGGQNATGADFELGVFFGNEVRGAVKAIWAAPLQAHVFFLTMYSNTPGELLTFKYFDGTEIYGLEETVWFSADALTGTLANPFKFSIGVSATDEAEVFEPFLDVLPNPLSDHATIRFRAPEQGLVRFDISDAAGRLVQSIEHQAIKGVNALHWEGAGLLAPGVYWLKMRTEKGLVMTEKVIVR